MRPGPPRTPTHLRLLKGNPGKRPMPRNEPQPAIEPECPEPPPFLEPYAQDEWWTVGPRLHRLGLLTIVDTAVFGAYCASYARWRVAQEALARVAARDPAMRGLLVRTVDGVKINPLVTVSRKAAQDMLRFAGEFGLTPAARTRIAGGVGGPPDDGKFSGLLATVIDAKG